MSTKHTCRLCNKSYASRQSLWKHLNTNNTSCVTREKYREIMAENESLKASCTMDEIMNLEDRITEKNLEISALKRENDHLRHQLTLASNLVRKLALRGFEHHIDHIE